MVKSLELISTNWLNSRGANPLWCPPHPVWVFGQFNLCGQAGPGKKLVVRLARKVQRGEGVMNYGRGPAEAVGGPTPLSCNEQASRSMPVM